MLMLASHEEKQWIWKGKKCKVQPGQFVTSLPSLANKSGTTVQNVRTALKLFTNVYEFSTHESTHQSTLVTIENWGIYQDYDTQDNTQANSELTDIQQTANRQLTAIKKDKNYKNERKKEDKKYIGSEIDLSFVFDSELLDPFREYVEHRKQMKKPLTQLAAKKAFNQLQTMSPSIDEQIQIINNSIANGWQGLFPLKDRQVKQSLSERIMNL